MKKVEASTLEEMWLNTMARRKGVKNTGLKKDIIPSYRTGRMANTRHRWHKKKNWEDDLPRDLAGYFDTKYMMSSEVLSMTQKNQKCTPYYKNELKLKQLYIRICRNLPAYNCKLYHMKQLLRENSSKKSCILGINSEKLVLLDFKAKTPLRSCPILDLQQWSTGNGKGHSGLVLEFRGSEPWSLELHRDVLNCDFSRRHRAMKCALEVCTVHSAELEQLQNLLHFPEEVAMSLTETEFELFNSVPATFYVRHVTLDLSRAVLTTRKPNVQDLIQRFHEVSSWITHIIVTQPTFENRKAVLSCILRVAQTCWNIGNFNGAIEILAGLKSEKLDPFWRSIPDMNLSVMKFLSDALLSREPTPAYRAAIARALAIPGCKVVPFFGGFLRDLRAIFSIVPSVVVLASEEAQIHCVTEFNGEDRFLTRIGVGGLVNLDKIRQAHVILNDIHLFHKRATAMTAHVQGKKTNSVDRLSPRRQNTTEPDADGDYNLDISNYQPIQPVGNDHQIMLIPAKLSWMHYHDLQCMHHGTTAVRCDSLTPQPFNCYLLLENDNATLSWSHLGWSSLNKGGSTGLSPDYDFKGVDDLKLPPGICAKYQEDKSFIEGPDEGHLDLDLVKEVIAGETSANPDHLVNLASISRQQGLPGIVTENNCLTIVYGRRLCENHFLKFVMPDRTAKMWFRGLSRLIQVAALQRRRTDKRIDWLKRQYLQLYFDAGRCHGPTPAEALKIFGGHMLVEGSASPRTVTLLQCFELKLDPTGVNITAIFIRPFMQPTHLHFVSFVNLFQTFSTCSRKDLKDLFEQFAVTVPRLERKMPKELLSKVSPSGESGLMTRNSPLDLPSDSTHKFDIVVSASVLCNSAGLESLRCKCLGVEELREFLATYQEETRSEWQIMELIQRHEPDAKMRVLCKLSFEGFARFLMDKDNYAFVPEDVREPDQNMKHPMSHYYIASSHNTYLPGKQVRGDSSVEVYSQVLKTGCRCVELDCWDGDDGYPVITHGLPVPVVSKVPFRAVVEAINRSAFEVSPYPVILSLENHCSSTQQQKMAEIFVEVFDKKLVRDYLFEMDFTDNPVLPSPDQLKYRILIKNKKTWTHHVPLRLAMNSSFDDDDEEEEEEEEEDVEGVSSQLGSPPRVTLTRRVNSYTMDRRSKKLPGGATGIMRTCSLMKRRKAVIAEKLSDLVIYTIAIKFNLDYIISGLDHQSMLEWSPLPGSQMSRHRNHSCYQVSSRSEGSMKRDCLRHAIKVIKYTERHLMRTYPGAWRIDSSNPNPLTFWPCGIQLVALNYQKDDPNMHINTAMFEQNARCGYVLKPPVFWDKTQALFNPFGRDFEGLKPTTLTIHLISGQYVFPHHDGSPQVEVEIIGIPVDLSKIRSLPVSRNSVNPIWNEAYTFQIRFPQLAFLRFSVMDTKGNENVAAQRVIPLKCLKPGYRHVRLRTSTNQPLDMATLFIYSSTTKQVPVKVPKRSFLINISDAMTDIMQLTVTEHTSVQEAIKLLLMKLGETDKRVEDYELVEAWEKGSKMKVLGMDDRVFHGQAKRGDTFVLRQRQKINATAAFLVKQTTKCFSGIH